MNKNKHCPLCNDNNGSIIYKKEKENISWKQCGECGLVYKTGENPEVVTNAAYYQEGQMRQTVPYRFGDPASAAPDAAFEEKCELQWNRFLKVKDYIHKDSSVMEIGCGSGGFLYIVNPMVHESIGVELDKELVNFCKSKLQLTVHDKLLNEIDFKGKKFDLICMFHVLEHFDNPKVFLTQVKEHLKPGGSVVIEVPCFNEALLQVFDLKKYRDIYFTIHHELYFTQKSISLLLNDCGYKPILFPFNEYGIANHLNWIQNDRPVMGASRQSGRCCRVASCNKTERNEDFVNDLNHWLKQTNNEYKELLAAHGFFDTIFCIAQKL